MKVIMVPSVERLEGRLSLSTGVVLAAAPSLLGSVPPAPVSPPEQLPPLVPDFGPLKVTWSGPDGTIQSYTNTITGTTGTITPDVVVITNWNSNIVQINPNVSPILNPGP